jgi:ribonucleoside-diphosphate reductase alpha chain
LKERYLKKDKEGKTIETPKQMLERVSKFIASAEITNKLQKEWEPKFFDLMADWKFLPGTRVLANAGKPRPQLANCFVFEISDSIDEIFKALYESSVTKKHGGGCGYNFSKIRPKGDSVGGEPNLAAGPIEIMKMFDLPTSIFRQQGKYESGNMAILNVNHPDILEFISSKENEGVLTKTNISIGVSDVFMEAVKKDTNWDLINPRNGVITNTLKARAIWELIITYAYRTGDPGMIFLDHINRNNPIVEKFGPIQATNPCGEIPQYPYESCNLGYMNLPIFVVKGEGIKPKVDFDSLSEACKVATRFMDNVIDTSWFPVEGQRTTIKEFRRLGIGVVGWAEMLTELGIVDGTVESLVLAEKVSKCIADSCHEASIALGKEKGPFPNIVYSKWKKSKEQPRNVTTNTLPPSSGNAVIFGTSYSIEPYFALAYYQNVLGGVRIKNVNEKLAKLLKSEGVHIENLFERIFENHGSIQSIKEIPAHIKKLFLTAHEIHWKDHIAMQAAWQKYIDNAITKTINMSSAETVETVEKAYKLAWEMGCKGVTVYRDNSKLSQVIDFGNSSEPVTNKQSNKTQKSMRELKGGDDCPECGSKLLSTEGCIKCLTCNFSLCQL